MSYICVGKANSADIKLYYKDWRSGQSIVFSHGWPLTADVLVVSLLSFSKNIA